MLNLILGMSYFDLFPVVNDLSELWTNFHGNWQVFLYPGIYFLLVPLTFNLTCKWFLPTTLVCWLLLLLNVILKMYSDQEWTRILSNIFIVTSTSLALPSFSVLNCKSFSKSNLKPSFGLLTFGVLAHPLGIGIRLTSSGIVPEFFIYILKFAIIDIMIILAVMQCFNNDLDQKLVKDDERFAGFFESLKFVYKNSNLFVITCCTSAQIGLIYAMSTIFESFYITNMTNFGVSEEDTRIYVKALGVIYCVTIVLGGFISVSVKESGKLFGALARVYSVFPFILMFFLGFVLKGLVFYLFYCVLSGLTFLHLLGYLHYSCLGYQTTVIRQIFSNSRKQNNPKPPIPQNQPFSVVLSFYFGLIFASFVRFLMVLFVYLDLSRSWLFCLLQLLITTSFLAVYDDFDNYFVHKSR